MYTFITTQIYRHTNSEICAEILQTPCKAIPTPSVKRRVKHQQQRQGPIRMHCDAPKWVPDPFPSVMASVKTSKLPLDA